MNLSEIHGNTSIQGIHFYGNDLKAIYSFVFLLGASEVVPIGERVTPTQREGLTAHYGGIGDRTLMALMQKGEENETNRL